MARLAALPFDILRNRQGRRTRPRFLTHILTFQCNARCVMCDSWKKPYDDDLTAAQIDAVYAKLPALDAVRLTGGEPFVRTDLAAIAASAARHLQPRFIHVTTNGFLTDRITAFCRDRDRSVPLRLLLSLDGTAETHNRVRGHPAAFAKAMATLAALAPQREAWNLQLAVNQTILDDRSMADYADLRAQVAAFGVPLFAVIAYAESATYDTRTDRVVETGEDRPFETYGELDREALAGFFDMLEADSGAFPAAERQCKRYYYDGMRARLLHGRSDPNPRCVALNAHLRLYPNGDVPTCQFNSRTVGNLWRDGFDEVWYGETAVTQREWVKRCTGCWAECEVVPSALYTADLATSVLRRRR